MTEQRGSRLAVVARCHEQTRQDRSSEGGHVALGQEVPGLAVYRGERREPAPGPVDAQPDRRRLPVGADHGRRGAVGVQASLDEQALVGLRQRPIDGAGVERRPQHHARHGAGQIGRECVYADHQRSVGVERLPDEGEPVRRTGHPACRFDPDRVADACRTAPRQADGGDGPRGRHPGNVVRIPLCPDAQLAGRHEPGGAPGRPDQTDRVAFSGCERDLVPVERPPVVGPVRR